MKFRLRDGEEVAELEVIDGNIFRVQAHDGFGNGNFLEPSYNLSRKRVVRDFMWIELLG